MGGEFAARGLHRAAAKVFDQRLDTAAVFDQAGDGADLQAMLGCEQLQVGQAGHGAVVLHDLADHGGWRTAGHGGQVATGLGMAGAHQHTTVNSLQRKDMARLDQVRRLCVYCHRRLHGAGPVRGRDTGGHALGGFDGDRERGAFLVAVAGHHGWQLQALAGLACQCEADQPASETRHEIDGGGIHVLGRQHQVAFVFAVFFVHQDHHATRSQVGDDVFHR
jgi:hypothetical protein